MVERPHVVSLKDLRAAYISLKSGKEYDGLSSLIEQMNDEYEYWSSVKYKKLPFPMPPQHLWTLVKASRWANSMVVWPKYGVNFYLTNKMQRICHELDMNFGGSWGNDSLIPEESKSMYLVSSLMEEAISSSQMEGAATMRKVAKEMLRKKIAPKDKSQQMIFNNYQTIQFIIANKEKPLTEELLLEVHRLMTENTLEKPEYAGHFRTNDDVVVGNGITQEIVHIPPACTDIPEFISQLCAFFNGNDGGKFFIHPIIRGITIHFMLAFVHPFADGNGRTARAIFYWYMLKQGYWLTEYLSISRIISRSKKSYEKTFMYSEADGNDMGYFVSYNLRVLDLAFKDFQQYIKRKSSDKEKSKRFLRLGIVNERQAEIMRRYYDNPDEVLTVKDVQVMFAVTPTTAKSDITKLLRMGALSEISFNKVKKGYIKGEKFDDIVSILP